MAAKLNIIPEGDIIGYKRCKEGIVKLLIKAEWKRSNATGRKCRAEKVYVLSTQNNKIATSIRGDSFIYEAGQIVSVDNFDEDRWNECSTGIHFFITEEEALDYEG